MNFIILVLFVGYFGYNIIQVSRAMATNCDNDILFKLFLFAAPLDLFYWIKSKL